MLLGAPQRDLGGLALSEGWVNLVGEGWHWGEGGASLA